MKDKELIKQEIERRYNCEKCHPLDIEAHVAAAVLQELLLFIDSLPEEEPFDYTNVNIIPKDFGELPKTIEQAAVQAHIELEEGNGLSFVNIFSKGAEWQKKIDGLKQEPASEDLEEAANFYANTHIEWFDSKGNPCVMPAFRAGAEWQKQQMMKDAVNGEVVYQIGSSIIAPTDIRYKVMSDKVYIPNVKLGDKVKIIIVKEN